MIETLGGLLVLYGDLLVFKERSFFLGGGGNLCCFLLGFFQIGGICAYIFWGVQNTGVEVLSG